MRFEPTPAVQSTDEAADSSPQVVPAELLSQIAGGLPYNVGAVVVGEGTSESSLPYNVG